ncbi:hypothetical protein NQN45_004371, partial [Vibrio vulnificus]|nr:hypothetical protein [Vibrio vulnificus]
MKNFRKHWIACAILSIPIAISGCNSESGNDGDTTNPNPAAKAPMASPILLTSPLPTNMASTIDLSSAITPGDGDNNVLTQLTLRSQASEGCESLPLLDGNRITLTPTDPNNDNVVMCSYDYTVGEGKLSATSTLAFAAVDGKTLTPSLPWLGGVGSVGEAIEVTVAAEGALNANVIVLGDTTTDPDVDTTAKTITFTGNELGVTRVMYTVTDPTSNETKVGIIDFTVSAGINTAPTASRGDITIAKDTVTTITLSSF